MSVEVVMAEQATGIRGNPNGLGKYYADEHTVLTAEQAYDHMRAGEGVEVPNAGAGSYREFFTSVGFMDVESFDTGSSAGDWNFIVHDGVEGDWYPAFQSNRYPRYGFRYSVNFDEGCETKEQCIAMMAAG